MQRGQEAIRFLSACHQCWCDGFPELQQRGQWQIVMHLGVRGRSGAAVGEIQGLVRQALLLDDATVRDRIGRLIQHGLCEPDPPGPALSARSVITPSDTFLTRFDVMVLHMGAHLAAAANAVEGHGFGAPAALDRGRGRAVVEAIEGCRAAWIEAAETLFRAARMSRARAVEARRHLLGGPHWLLTQLALEHALGLSPHGFAPGGIQADRLAAIMVQVNGQNFQTTRDHINDLFAMGLLERRAGRSLHVGFPAEALTHFTTSLAAASAALPGWAAALRTGSDPAVLDPTTTTTQQLVAAGASPSRRWALTVHQPEHERRVIPLDGGSVVIGRAPGEGATVTLAATDVSRRHCRIDMTDGVLRITDLASTNGTHVNGERIVGTVALPENALVLIGSFVVSCGPADRLATGRTRPAMGRNKSGNSV